MIVLMSNLKVAKLKKFVTEFCTLTKTWGFGEEIGIF
jgi:hypothetical protein